jgi:riboflavin synthase
MFAGIVSAVGRIVSAEPHGDGLRLRIQAEELGLDDVKVGDSIALAGACHTVVARSGVAFDVDTSRATIAVTTGLAAGREVNLEKSLRLADRIDGHLVAGHVDGVGTVTGFEELGGSVRLEVQAPAELARYIARKGSITVDGVSLTVNRIDGARFSVNLIPHTRAVTTLGGLALGARVNLEVDMLARYVERLVSFDREGK